MMMTDTAILDGIKQRDAFVLTLMKALHLFGTPSHRLEQAMAGMARDLDMHIQVLATPTSINAAIGKLENQRAFLLRVEPSEANLAKLADLQGVMQQVSRGELNPGEARHVIDDIVERPSHFAAPITVLAFCVVATCVAVLLNGSIMDAAIAAVLGGCVGVLAALSGTRPRLGMLLPTLSAAFTAAAARLIAEFVPNVHPIVVTLASLIVLVPGLSLTMGVNELAHRHLISGTARMMGSLVVLLQLALGAAAGWGLVNVFVGTFEADAMVTPAWWSMSLAIIASAAAFIVLFKARWQDYIAVLLVGALAFVASRFGISLFSPEFGAALGAWSMGSLSNILSRLRDKPALTTILPSIILLVPGTLGFRSIQAILHNEVGMGLEAATTTFMVAIALVIGLFLSNLTISPRKIL